MTPIENPKSRVIVYMPHKPADRMDHSDDLTRLTLGDMIALLFCFVSGAASASLMWYYLL